ncbi:MAG: hypothetical protein R3A52_17315 [Polyangiales bacterium]
MSTTERGPLPREGWVDVGAARPVAMKSRVDLWGELFLLTFLLSAWSSIGMGLSFRLSFSGAAVCAGVMALILRGVLNEGALARVVVLRAQFAALFAISAAGFIAAKGAAGDGPTTLGMLLLVVGLPIVFPRFAPWQRSPRFSRNLRVAALTAVALSASTAALSSRGGTALALVGAVVGALYLASAWRHRPSAARARWREGTFSPDTGLCVGDARLDASLVPAHYVGPVVVELPETALRGAYRDGAARPTAVIAGSLTNVEYLLTDRYDVSLARALALSLVCAAPAFGHLLRQLAR